MPHGYFADSTRVYKGGSYTPDTEVSRPPDRHPEVVGSAIMEIATTEQSELGEE